MDNMSNTLPKKAPFSNPDAAPSGRPRRTSRPKSVTEERARAQRQKVDRGRESRLESPGIKEYPAVSRPLALKVGSQTMTVKRALEGYIEDQIGGNRSKKTIEWHRTALGLFTTYLE